MTAPSVIVFKHEDEVNREPVGPAVGYTKAELDDAVASNSIGVPYDPNRINRWVTRAQALALAAEYDAEFRES